MAEGDSIIKYKDLIGEDDTFEVISANIKKIEKELLAMVKATDKAFDSLNPNDTGGLDKIEKQVIANEKAKKQAIKTQKAANALKKKTINLTNEQLIQLQKEKIVQRERIARAKQQAIIDKEGKQNIASLRAQLSLATLDWKKLTDAEIKNNKVLDKSGKTAKQVVAQKKSLTKQLKKLEEATDDHRRSVGKYSNSLTRMGKIATRVFVGRSIVDGLRSIASGVLSLIENNRGASKSLDSLGKTFDSTGSALKGAAVKLLTLFAPALEAVANGIKAVTEFLFGMGDGSKKASEGVRELQSEFNAEIEVLKKGNISTEARSQLISDINTKYKKYLPNLIKESDSLDDITKAQNGANKAFEKSILLLATKEASIEISRKYVDALREEARLQTELSDAESARSRAARTGKTGTSGVNIAFTKAKTAAVQAKARIASNKILIAQITEEKRLLDEVIAATGLSAEDFTKSEDKKTDAVKKGVAKRATNNGEGLEAAAAALLKESEDAEKARAAAAEKRLKALEELIKEVEKLEAEGIEIKTDRLLALEQLRFDQEQEIRAFQFEKLKVLTNQQGEDLQEVADLNDLKSEQQEANHQANMAKIREDGVRAEQKAFDDEVASTEAEMARIEAMEGEISDKKVAKAIKDGEKIKEINKEVNKDILDHILETNKKIGGLINDVFKQQVDLSAKAVTEQEGNLERARQRASDGLDNNLLYEEQKLSERQAENRKRQEEAKNIAKVVALFNLTSAAAASGDKNAVTTALVQFGVLTGFEALFGFEQGTENVEKSLGKGAAVRGGTDGYLGVTSTGKAFRFDGKERIVNGDDNAALGGMSAEDLVPNALLGSAMSDYFDRPTQLANNSYKQQQESFKKAVAEKKTDNSMLNELKGIKAQLSSQPNYSAQIVKVQEELTEFVLTENKGNMKKIIKRLLRGK